MADLAGVAEAVVPPGGVVSEVVGVVSEVVGAPLGVADLVGVEASPSAAEDAVADVEV